MKNIALFLSIIAFTFACSSESTEEKQEVKFNTEVPKKEKAEAKVDEASSVGVNEIVIESNDLMKYNLSEIRVKAGEMVKITLKHVGKLPKASMGHNWVLLKSGVDMQEFAQAASQARENEYIASEESIIAHTSLVGGGESTSIEFEAPSTGFYEFLCSFPGHYGMMKGNFIVE